jgi:hypothetical protein
MTLLSRCASTSSAPAPNLSPQTAYQRDIHSMTPYWPQNATQLERWVGAVHKIEVALGITDESLTHLAAHLFTVVSAYTNRVHRPVRRLRPSPPGRIAPHRAQRDIGLGSEADILHPVPDQLRNQNSPH